MPLSTSNIFVTSLCVTLLFFSCTTSKSLMKDGREFEQAQMYEEAVNAYKASLGRNISNVEAKIGLKSAAERLLQEELSNFNRQKVLGNTRDAVYAYKEAEDFQQSLKRFGVNLDIPIVYTQDYMKVEDDYLSNLYLEGTELLEEEKFEQAEAMFQEIAELHPGFEDVETKLDKAMLEPEYRGAVALMNQGRYREAYTGFDRIIRQDASYKDAVELMGRCLEEGRFVMAMLPFDAHGFPAAVASRVQAYTMDGISDLNDPFLKVVDRQNLDQILAEQQFSLSGVIDENSAVEVGNLTGAEAILMAEIIDYREMPGQVQRQTLRGYESYTAMEKNDAGEERKVTRYRPTRYEEFQASSKVDISVHVKLVSLETGEVLFSEIVDRDIQDNVEYLQYEGNLSRLFPERNERPWTSRSAVNALRGKAESRRELAPLSQLSNELNESVGTAIAVRMKNFLSR